MDSDEQRIGIFGGTFDPPHSAHLDIARAALEHARLDRVVFMVSASPPHKSQEEITDAEDRLEMVRAAIGNNPRLEASRMEIDRPGPSYTVDTLEEMGRRYSNAVFFLIMGYDSLLDLPKWRSPGAILAQSRVLAIPRPGERKPPPPMLEGHFELVPYEEVQVSTTEIRERLARGEPVDELVPEAVREIIRRRGLYGVNIEQR